MWQPCGRRRSMSPRSVGTGSASLVPPACPPAISSMMTCCLIAAILCVVPSRSSSQDTSPEIRRIVVVPAQTEWHDTGIDLLGGDGLTVFSPKGSWSNYNGQGALFTNADGFVGDIDPQNYMVNVPRAALIGRVGEHRFLLGRKFSGNSPARGRLYLAMNDRPGTYDDNAGRIIVEIVKVANPVPMPDVVHLSPQQARERIEQAIHGRLSIEVQDVPQTSDVQKGEVVASRPTAGQDLRAFKGVVLTVSSGPEAGPGHGSGNRDGKDTGEEDLPPKEEPKGDPPKPETSVSPSPGDRAASSPQFEAIERRIKVIEIRLTAITALCIVLCGVFVLTAMHLLKKIRWVDRLRTNVRIVPGGFRVEGGTLRADMAFQFRMRVHPGEVDFPDGLPIAEIQSRQTP